MRAFVHACATPAHAHLSVLAHQHWTMNIRRIANEWWRTTADDNTAAAQICSYLLLSDATLSTAWRKTLRYQQRAVTRRARASGDVARLRAPRARSAGSAKALKTNISQHQACGVI